MRTPKNVSVLLAGIAALLFVPTNAIAQGTYSYTVFDAPSPGDVTWTTVNGLNDAGQVIGIYYYYIRATQTWGRVFSFLKTDNTFVAIDDPHDPGDSIANGINNKGQIVGTFGNHVHQWGGKSSDSFLITGNTFTLLTTPGNLRD